MTFEAAYAAYWPLAFRVARRILRDREAAEDAAGDALVKVWRNWDHAVEPKAYILTAVRRVAHEQRRRRALVSFVSLEAPSNRYDRGEWESTVIVSDPTWTRRENTVAPNDPVRETEQAETLGAAVAALRALCPSHRAAFWLCQVEGLSYVEAATCLGTTAGTVKTALCRARRQFKRAWAGLPVRQASVRTRPRTNPLTTEARRAQWREAKRRQKERRVA